MISTGHEKNCFSQKGMLTQNKITNFSQFLPIIAAMFWGSFPVVRGPGGLCINLITLWKGLYATTTVVVVVVERTSFSFHSISYEI